MDQTNIGYRRQRCMRWPSVEPMLAAGGTRMAARAAWLLLGAALWAPCALAEEIAGAKPGDESLTCEQIYAQGMAESQREKELRDEKAQANKRRLQGFSALAASAMLTSNPVLGAAAQRSAEDMARGQLQMAQTPDQSNARKDRLRQLWTQKRCSAPSAADAKTPDEAMTCAQIAAEIAPYAQQIAPNVQATARAQGQVNEQALTLGQQQHAENTALSAMATAGALDPTGISKRAYAAAQMALTQKQKREQEALANSPQAKQAEAQLNQFMAQGQQLRADARLQQLMALGQQKGCDRK